MQKGKRKEKARLGETRIQASVSGTGKGPQTQKAQENS